VLFRSSNSYLKSLSQIGGKSLGQSTKKVEEETDIVFSRANVLLEG
jgi:hypothetical protein